MCQGSLVGRAGIVCGPNRLKEKKKQEKKKKKTEENRILYVFICGKMHIISNLLSVHNVFFVFFSPNVYTSCCQKGISSSIPQDISSSTSPLSATFVKQWSILLLFKHLNGIPSRLCFIIHLLHLCKGVRSPTNECLGYDTKQSIGWNNKIVVPKKTTVQLYF